MTKTVLDVKVFPVTENIEVTVEYEPNAILITGGTDDGEIITDSLDAPISALTDTAGLASISLQRDSNMVQVEGAVQQVRVKVPDAGYDELITIPDTTPEDLADISPVP